MTADERLELRWQHRVAPLLNHARIYQARLCLGAVSGSGLKIIKMSEVPIFLELIFQWRESLKTRKDKPHKAVCLPSVNFSVCELYLKKVKKEKTSALIGLRVHLRTVDPHSSLVYAVLLLADVCPWAQKLISWSFCGRLWVCTGQWHVWLTWRACPPAEGEPGDTLPVQLLLWASSLFAVCLMQCPCIFVLFSWWLSCLLWPSWVMLRHCLGILITWRQWWIWQTI